MSHSLDVKLQEASLINFEVNEKVRTVFGNGKIVRVEGDTFICVLDKWDDVKIKPSIQIKKSQISKIQNTKEFLLSDNDSQLHITLLSYGAMISSIKMADKEGNIEEITLGYRTVEELKRNPGPYFGASVGRVANRVLFYRYLSYRIPIYHVLVA